MTDNTSITTPIPLSLVCRDQSGGAHQLGFRLLGDAAIRSFGHAFSEPCANWGWSSFSEWEDRLDSLPRGARIRPYTRDLMMSDGASTVLAHLTIARNSRTARFARAQGWITARKDSVLYDFVAGHLYETIRCAFVPGRERDSLLLLPGAMRANRAA